MGSHMMTPAEIEALHVNFVRMLAVWDVTERKRLLEGQPWWSAR